MNALACQVLKEQEEKPWTQLARAWIVGKVQVELGLKKKKNESFNEAEPSSSLSQDAI